MTLTPSTMGELDAPAPHFTLPDPATGRDVSLSDFAEAPALLVAFICNHCPFVVHIADHFAGFAARATEKGVAVVAINSNDAKTYPADAPGVMPEEARRRGYGFPYLHDESQEVAKAYGAACTPDFFLYDRDRRLAYRGQYDSSRPSLDTPVTGSDLGAAIDLVIKGLSQHGMQHQVEAGKRPTLVRVRARRPGGGRNTTHPPGRRNYESPSSCWGSVVSSSTW